uniref:Uncharacterized protein n=1 Tax=Tetranychus urticae TaxID=32264 RepID=T1K8G3_TETUR
MCSSRVIIIKHFSTVDDNYHPFHNHHCLEMASTNPKMFEQFDR